MAKKEDRRIPLSKEHKEEIKALLKEYLAEELDCEAGNLQCEFFTDFISERVGIYYYNRAIEDALRFMTEKTEDLYLLMKDE